MSQLFDLTGKIALVTGANTGIGQGITLALAEAGADIVAVGRTAPSETEKLVKAAGRRFAFVSADLTDPGLAGGVVGEAASLIGTPDILVNNAGTIRRADALD